jgi:hypothetical protein
MRKKAGPDRSIDLEMGISARLAEPGFPHDRIVRPIRGRGKTQER